jgi:hypothetical protein
MGRVTGEVHDDHEHHFNDEPTVEPPWDEPHVMSAPRYKYIVVFVFSPSCLSFLGIFYMYVLYGNGLLSVMLPLPILESKC